MKHLNLKTVQVIMFCGVLSFICEGCCAQTPSEKAPSMFAVIDSTMRAGIGDSISALILGSKQVIAERILVKNDSLSVTAKKKLKGEEASIVKFLFVTTEEFNDNAVVFGKFSPNIRFTFKLSKKNYCTAYLDFGLKQIVIRDSKGKDIKMFGIKDDGYIKYANVLFPNDKFLMFMLNQK